jgi:motility quorum-sensing regulator / GCU-specific mRNA interferase toxin
VKRLIRSGQCKLVQTAKQTAHSLGYSETEAMDVVAALEMKDFRKSETEFYNNTVWQDYYSKMVNEVDIFIKLKITQIEDQVVLILSFKRDENAGGAL